MLEQFEGRQPNGPAAYMLAAAYVAMGEKDRAYPFLERGVSDRSQPAWRQLPWDPIWDPIREDARFRAVLAHMGL